MDTVASGHTFMDTEQTYHATRLVIESLALEVCVYVPVPRHATKQQQCGKCLVFMVRRGTMVDGNARKGWHTSRWTHSTPISPHKTR